LVILSGNGFVVPSLNEFFLRSPLDVDVPRLAREVARLQVFARENFISLDHVWFLSGSGWVGMLGWCLKAARAGTASR
jgi:hypothetical protein